MAITITPESEFLSAIREALTRKAEAILHEEAEAAVKRSRERIQGHVGSIVTSLLNQYRITMRGDALEIIVKIEHLPDAARES